MQYGPIEFDVIVDSCLPVKVNMKHWADDVSVPVQHIDTKIVNN